MWKVRRIETTPPAAPGFIGAGHTAVEVVRPDALGDSDPFVLLMDDRLDIPVRRAIGGAHPHAGLETVTFVIEGVLHDRDEGELRTGDVLWMTAGGGIIHNEHVEAEGRSRVLQLWIGLPARDRELAPGFELVRREDAPVVRDGGAVVRIYSGAVRGVRSPTRNRVATTMLDVALDGGATFAVDLPATYNGFAYVLDGAARIAGTAVRAGQVAWLGGAPGAGDLDLAADAGGARVVLYAGEPIREPMIQHGPFVAGSPAEIHGYHGRFRAGRFTSMSQLARARRAALAR